MVGVGYLAAFLGGLLALISPCSALLLPSFFAYAFGSAAQLMARTGVFYLGLIAVLVPVGVGSSALGALLTVHRPTLTLVAGWLILGLGIVQIVGGGWSLGPAARLQQRMVARSSWLSTAALGGAYGLAGFCSGPILGAVLTVAAAGAQPVRGAALLAVYALGMGAPLFVLSGLYQRFHLGQRKWLRGRSFRVGPLRLHTTSLLSGLLFMAVGAIFLLSDGTATLPTLDARSSLAIEDLVASVSADVPDVIVLLGVGVAVAAITTWRLRRTPLHHSVHEHGSADAPRKAVPDGVTMRRSLDHLGQPSPPTSDGRVGGGQ